MTWLLNSSEAGVDLVFSSCSYANYLVFTWEKQRGLYQNKVTSSLACVHGQVTKHTTVKWPITAWCKHSDRISWQGRSLRVTVIGSTTLELTILQGPKFPCFKSATKSKTRCLFIWNNKWKRQTIVHDNESLTEAWEYNVQHIQGLQYFVE